MAQYRTPRYQTEAEYQSGQILTDLDYQYRMVQLAKAHWRRQRNLLLVSCGFFLVSGIIIYIALRVN